MLERVREEVRVKIRREKIDHDLNFKRKKFIKQVQQSSPMLMAHLRYFTISLYTLQYNECEDAIPFLYDHLQLLENETVRAQASILKIDFGLILMIEKVKSPLIKYKIFQILLIMSEYEQFIEQILKNIKRILEYGYQYLFSLSCAIFGNILGYSKTNKTMLSFIINEEIEGMILLKIVEGKKYPLQYWLKFSFPYRSSLEENKYSTETAFFKKIQELCILVYQQESDTISQMDEVILQYISKGTIKQLEKTEVNMKFLLKVSKSKHTKYSFKIIERYSLWNCWIQFDYLSLQEIIFHTTSHQSVQITQMGLRILKNLLSFSTNELLAQSLIEKILADNNFQLIFEEVQYFENEIVDLIRMIFFQIENEYKPRLMKLIPIERLRGQHHKILYELLQMQISNQEQRDINLQFLNEQ